MGWPCAAVQLDRGLQPSRHFCMRWVAITSSILKGMFVRVGTQHEHYPYTGISYAECLLGLVHSMDIVLVQGLAIQNVC